MAFIHSTLASDQQFNVYDTKTGTPKVKGSVIIAGKAKMLNRALITPTGIMTEVDDGTLAIIEGNKAFKRFIDRGYFKVTKSRADTEKVAEDLSADDKSQQLNEDDVDPELTVESKPAKKTVTSRKRKA